MSSPPKPLDILQAGDQEPWTDSSIDKQPSSPPANPSSKPEQPLTPHESTSPSLPKSQADDAETSSSLSPAPSPLTTHRPTSSKTSIDDQPLTPLDSPEKASQSAKDPPESVPDHPKEPEQDAEEKAEAQPLKQPSPAPVEKPVESPKIVLPEDKVGTILQLNAELLNVYNEFHTQDQVLTLPNELQQYSIRIQANVQWLMQYKETLGTQFASRVPLQIISPPPPVPFTSIESINALYAHLNSLFEKENARAQRKQQLRQMMLAGSGIPMAGVSASSPTNVNANGKRERTEDDQPGSEVTGDHSPRKRVDTGESKPTPGMPSTNTPSPASMHASPSRMNASPSHTNASTNANPAPGAPGGPLRPSSSQSNSSSHTNTPQVPMAPPPTFPGGAGGAVNGAQGMMGPQQQLDRMRMIQQNRMRAMGGGAGSNGSPQTMMNGGGAGVPQQQNQNPPAQQGQNQNINPNIAAQISGLGIAPRPVPPAILPQLMAMIQNPQMHTSVQLLHSKIPGFRTMPGEQQAGVLWAFQQNQMRQQQEMQHRQMQQQHQMQQMQQNMQGQGQQMPGQMQGQNQMQQQGGMQNGYPQNAAMGMGGMRPTSAGSMHPPPSPHLIQQQRQLNLMQQQQQAAMGRGPAPGMAGGGYPGGAMNPGMGMGMGGMNIGGHARMPSNPTMGPPPVPGSISTPQSMYSQGMNNGMNQYQPGAVNPMNLSYPMQPQLQHQQHQPQPQLQHQQHQPQQQQQYGMHHQSPSMAGSPPNSASSTAWSPMSGGGGSQPLTPAVIMQQQQAKMGGMSPAPGPGGGGVGSIDPNSLINWQDLAAT